MSTLTYLSYLLLFLPLLGFSVWITKERVLNDEPKLTEYLGATILVLTFWGELAMKFHQWYFPREYNLGIYLGNHPLETIIQGFIMPIFILSVWEFVKRK